MVSHTAVEYVLVKLTVDVKCTVSATIMCLPSVARKYRNHKMPIDNCKDIDIDYFTIVFAISTNRYRHRL